MPVPERGRPERERLVTWLLEQPTPGQRQGSGSVVFHGEFDKRPARLVMAPFWLGESPVKQGGIQKRKKVVEKKERNVTVELFMLSRKSCSNAMRMQTYTLVKVITQPI